MVFNAPRDMLFICIFFVFNSVPITDHITWFFNVELVLYTVDEFHSFMGYNSF
jgi:hypothetical protein